MPEIELTTLYTQALRLLGVVAPGARGLSAPLSVQPVQIVADVSDVTIPHGNPQFGFRSALAAGAGVFACHIIEARARPVQIRQIHVSAGTNVRLQVFAAADNPISAANVTIAPASLGPVVNTPTSFVERGTSAAAPSGSGFEPEQTQWNIRPPWLIPPGFLLLIADNIAQTTPIVTVAYEEIPGQSESANLGFPVQEGT